MPIYAKTNNNEYNKIIDIFDTNGIDITDVYHDDQLVYTVSKDISGSTELYYNTNRYDITNFRVYGNTIQDGTPSPDAPVDVVGCGVRTGNLAPPLTEWEDGYVAAAGGAILRPSSTLLEKVTGLLPIPAGSSKVSFLGEDGDFESGSNGAWRAIGFYGPDGAFISRPGGNGTSAITVSVPEGAAFMRVCCRTYGSDKNYMLNLGSTPLPYEPYGYKLPMTVNGTEYPIYLGQVESTRRVKKLVLTGEERWQFYSDNNSPYGAWQFYVAGAIDGLALSSALSNIAGYGATATTRARYLYGVYLVTSGTGVAFQMAGAKDVFTDITSWKSYLAQQYAAGTPVTVWYVLATPETAIVNEPLMKIGNYADSINIVQSNPQLKLDIGENNIYVSTPVPPSNMELQAKGGISVSGTSSLQINRKSEYLSDYKISGDTLQDGTPSPNMPIEVVGCGVRTGNLFDYKSVYAKFIDDDGNVATTANLISEWNKFPAELIGKTVTISFYAASVGATGVFVQVHIGGSFQRGNMIREGNVGYSQITVTPESSADEWRVSYSTGVIPVVLNQFVVAESEKRLDYEPYGYKLPLTVNGTEYPIYLGQVETTRRVKKLVLTGKENFKRTSNGCFYWTGGITDYSRVQNVDMCRCTHFGSQPLVWGTSAVTTNNIAFYQSTVKSEFYCAARNISSDDDFKSYLAAQYAAGTPVTVWYVLAEPETAIVNEPLMKIGDYADTISFAQAGMTIPTVNGANTLDMTSPVKPSEVYIKGKGIKPTGYGQLADVNGVNILDKDGRPIYVHDQ